MVIDRGDCGPSSDYPRYLEIGSARILGTLIGATVAGFYLYFFSFTVVGMAISVGLTVLLCQMVEVPDHGRLAAHRGASHGDFERQSRVVADCKCGVAFIESAIGVGIAVLAVLLWPKAEETT